MVIMATGIACGQGTHKEGSDGVVQDEGHTPANQFT